MSRQAGKLVFIEPKDPDFNHYRGATVLTPNRRELSAVIGTCHDERKLVDKATALLSRYDLQALLITLGERGMILIRAGHPALHLSAYTHAVYDVTGVGDMVIALLALTYVAQAGLVNVARIANMAAGIVMTKLGAVVISVDKLKEAIQTRCLASQGIISAEEQLQVIVQQARANGERIVL